MPKALGVLSLNTVFYEDSLSETQLEKFRKGLAGNHEGSLEALQQLVAERRPILRKKFRNLHIRKPSSMPNLQPMSILDIPLNKACPVDNSMRQLVPTTDAEQLEALVASWRSVPQVTFDFLERHERWDILPTEVVGNSYQLELNRPHATHVGRIGVIQEPQLKARIVANPNRITQHTLAPIRTVYEQLDRALPSTCIHDQEAGMRRVQAQLRQGHKIAGSDLTSASDLLDLDCCLWIVNRFFGLDKIKGYVDYAQYFKEVSRSSWYFPQGKESVSWNQGDPLGTEPSIFLLDLANTCAALVAWADAVDEGSISPSTDPFECFGTLGDDVWMLAEMQPSYERVIGLMGGEINHSKTLISDRIAEFAGRVITPEHVYLKKVNYCEPSDNSFMNYMSQLGPQAKWLLRPRQRKVYEMFSHLPGVVVPGPWSLDSFGEPLASRYQWYLEEVEPVLHREEPDPKPETVGQVELRADLRLQQDKGISAPEGLVRPIMEPEDYPSSVATQSGSHGDPRNANGHSLLEVLEEHGHHITPYSQWKDQRPPLPEKEEVVTPGTGNVSPTAVQRNPLQEMANVKRQLEKTFGPHSNNPHVKRLRSLFSELPSDGVANEPPAPPENQQVAKSEVPLRNLDHYKSILEREIREVGLSDPGCSDQDDRSL
jgi:hypothetical protein